MDATSFSLSLRVSRPVDGALVNLRWAVIALAWAALWLVTGSPVPERIALLWFITYSVFNVLLWIGVRYRDLPPRLPVIALVGDIVWLGILPLLPGVNSPLLVLFGIFPTLVAAMRFGVPIGALVALVVVLPNLLTLLLPLVPFVLRDTTRLPVLGPAELFPTLFPIAALFGAVILVGYLAEREREAAIGSAQVELNELRRAISSARILYESYDALGSDADYVRILDVLVQAGVSGMPTGTFDRGSPVGIALLFDRGAAQDAKTLKVAAARGLDRSDQQRVLAGRQGIVGRAIESGDPIPFGRTANDPELEVFNALRHCRAGICYPLQSGLDIFGVVLFGTPNSQLPSEEHQRLLRAFINQAAVALQNATLYQNLRAERDRIVEAEAAARAKLARDLHDGPTQSIAALAMRLDFIRMQMDRDPAQAKQEVEQARQAVVRVGKELRGLLFTLRPLTLETQGLSAALEQYGNRLRENENVPIDVQAGNFGVELDANVAATVFAILEEAINNARKHGQAAPIHVTLQAQHDTLIAMVRDEGPGFDVNLVDLDYSARGSLGMVNMRDRARLIDGQLNIESAPGRGTRVTLRVPLTGRITRDTHSRA